MRMKEDHMRNGQLKPAYNVQIAVNSEYITGVDVFSNRTDFDTPVPFLKTLQELRKASQENIATESGIYLRLCRSIQVEGAFGLLKTDFGFRRLLTRGKANVRIELFFLALAFNLKKLWMKRENGRLQTHLSQLSSA